jgi:hypothetical protein
MPIKTAAKTAAVFAMMTTCFGFKAFHSENDLALSPALKALLDSKKQIVQNITTDSCGIEYFAKHAGFSDPVIVISGINQDSTSFLYLAGVKVDDGLVSKEEIYLQANEITKGTKEYEYTLVKPDGNQGKFSGKFVYRDGRYAETLRIEN